MSIARPDDLSWLLKHDHICTHNTAHTREMSKKIKGKVRRKAWGKLIPICNACTLDAESGVRWAVLCQLDSR